MDPYIYGQLTLKNVPKYFNEEIIVISTKSSRQLDIHVENGASTHFTLQIKTNLKLITDLTINDESIKFKEEIREEFYSTWLENY